jgi:hypothetical protein
MYRQSKSPIRKFLLAQFLTALLLFTTTFTGLAQTAVNQPDPATNISVKFLGLENDMMVFSVHFANEKESKCNVSIYNHSGEVLFRDIFQVKYFDKKFKIPKENGQLDFVVANVTNKVTRNIKVDQALPLSVVKKD